MDSQDKDPNHKGEQDDETPLDEPIGNLKLEREEHNLDLGVLFISFESKQLLDHFDEIHDDDLQHESPEDLCWIDEEFGEEWESQSRTSSSDHDTPSGSAGDHIKRQDDLLAEWFQIETDMGIPDVVQSEGTNMSTNESSGIKTEAVLADWYLLGKALEGEKQLVGIVAQCGGTDDDTKVKIDYIASIRIKDIAAVAQEDLQKLMKACGTSCNISVAVNSEVPIQADVATLIESKPSFIRSYGQTMITASVITTVTDCVWISSLQTLILMLKT